MENKVRTYNYHSRMSCLYDKTVRGDVKTVILDKHPVFSQLKNESINFLSKIQLQDFPVTEKQEEELIRILCPSEVNILENHMFKGRKLDIFSIFESLFEPNDSDNIGDKVVDIMNIS